MDPREPLVDLEHWLSVIPIDAQARLLATLALSLVLCLSIGFERELRLKSAGLRTHTLVGVASCLIMLVSKYGFADVIRAYEITLDPARIAAQIVSGIGFLGGGLIFVQRDVVRGLTTAATIWLAAGIGMACGAGLPVLAVFVTALHFLVLYGVTPLARLLLVEEMELQIDFQHGPGALQRVIEACAARGFEVDRVRLESRADDRPEGRTGEGAGQRLRLRVRVRGRRRLPELLGALGDLDGVTALRHSRRH